MIRAMDPTIVVIVYKGCAKPETKLTGAGRNRRQARDPLSNFHGIELHDFRAEIARLALIIAEHLPVHGHEIDDGWFVWHTA